MNIINEHDEFKKLISVTREMWDELHKAQTCSGLMPMYSQRINEAEAALAQLEIKSELKLNTDVIEKAAKYDAINTPEIEDFIKAIRNEALHQRERWGSEHDAGKTDADWFWLIGYLAGKALHKPEKILHHIITTAAACLNWHAAKVGAHNGMRPGTQNTSSE